MFDEQGRLDVGDFEQQLGAPARGPGPRARDPQLALPQPDGLLVRRRRVARRRRRRRPRGGARRPSRSSLDVAYARYGAADLRQRHRSRSSCSPARRSSSSRGPPPSRSPQYGLRVGALVAVHPDAAERSRLDNAFSYACRGTWSNCNAGGMAAITRVLSRPGAPRPRRPASAAPLKALLDRRVARWNELAGPAGLRYPRYDGGFFTTVFCDDAGRGVRPPQGRGRLRRPAARRAPRRPLLRRRAGHPPPGRRHGARPRLSGVPRDLSALGLGQRCGDTRAPLWYLWDPMRAHSSRRSHTRAAVLFAGFLMAAFAACADAVHLAPPGADAGTSTTTGGGGCKSNPDCPYPTPVCDAVSGKCVQCLVLSDCADMPGTVCSKGACECPSPDGAAALTYCAGRRAGLRRHQDLGGELRQVRARLPGRRALCQGRLQGRHHLDERHGRRRAGRAAPPEREALAGRAAPPRRAAPPERAAAAPEASPAHFSWRSAPAPGAASLHPGAATLRRARRPCAGSPGIFSRCRAPAPRAAPLRRLLAHLSGCSALRRVQRLRAACAPLRRVQRLCARAAPCAGSP